MVSPGTILGLLAGNFDFVQFSWGALTVSDVFTDILKLFATPCVCMCALCVLAWVSSPPVRLSKTLYSREVSPAVLALLY